MTDKSIFKAVVLTFFITFTLVAIGFFMVALRGISVGTAGTYAVTGGASYTFIRLTFVGASVGIVIITYLVLIWRKLKR